MFKKIFAFIAACACMTFFTQNAMAECTSRCQTENVKPVNAKASNSKKEKAKQKAQQKTQNKAQKKAQRKAHKK